MSRSVLSKYLAGIGSKGGKAKARALTKKQRRAIAVKALRVAARVRTNRLSRLIQTATKSQVARSSPFELK
jgi:hypothetical protein